MRVGEALAHQVHEIASAHHVQSLLAVRGEQHVSRLQRHAGGDRDRLLTRGLDVEGDASLALDPLHAIVEQAGQQHVAQADLQLRRLEVRVPGTHGHLVITQDAYQFFRELFDVPGRGGDIGPVHRTGGRQAEVAEIRLLPRACRRCGNVQA